MDVEIYCGESGRLLAKAPSFLLRSCPRTGPADEWAEWAAEHPRFKRMTTTATAHAWQASTGAGQCAPEDAWSYVTWIAALDWQDAGEPSEVYI